MAIQVTPTLESSAITECEVRHAWCASPIGRILLSGDEHGLSRVKLNTENRQVMPDEGSVEDEELFRDAIEQLGAYFAGDLTQFDLKTQPKGHRIPATRLA